MATIIALAATLLHLRPGAGMSFVERFRLSSVLHSSTNNLRLKTEAWVQLMTNQKTEICLGGLRKNGERRWRKCGKLKKCRM